MSRGFCSSLPDAKHAVSVTQLGYMQELKSFYKYSPRVLRGDSQGNRIWVKCQTDPVTHSDNSGDLIKRNTALYQLRSCVGRLRNTERVRRA